MLWFCCAAAKVERRRFLLLSLSLLLCCVLSFVSAANLRFSFDGNLGRFPPPCNHTRLFVLVGANFVSLETGKERTRRKVRKGEKEGGGPEVVSGSGPLSIFVR